MTMPSVVVTFEPRFPGMREAIEQTLDELAAVTFLSDSDSDRASALAAADALLVWGIGAELTQDELHRLDVELVQLVSAGANHIPFGLLAPSIRVAANGGGWAGPMAEHVLAMTLALAKRLPQNHALLARGVFDQRTPSKALDGCVVAILGYGGIGRASARLFRALGARIHAVTRSGRPENDVELTASLDELDGVVAAADVLLLSLPLTVATAGLIARRELELMKPDAILVNVARAEIIDEDALYEHLRDTPSFSAGLDVWWQEGGRDGFATRRPFFELPNVLGSPHVSANAAGSPARAAGHAAENVARYLRGEAVLHLVDRAEYQH